MVTCKRKKDKIKQLTCQSCGFILGCKYSLERHLENNVCLNGKIANKKFKIKLKTNIDNSSKDKIMINGNSNLH